MEEREIVRPTGRARRSEGERRVCRQPVSREGLHQNKTDAGGREGGREGGKEGEREGGVQAWRGRRDRRQRPVIGKRWRMQKEEG